MQEYVTAKFGGSSLADASRIKQVTSIIRSNKKRKYVVVSAPGKRNPRDFKITNLLIECADLTKKNKSFDSIFALIKSRFLTIGTQLNCGIASSLLDQVYLGIKNKKGHDWIVSRGEWLMAQIIADYIDAVFIDAAELLTINHEGFIEFSQNAYLQNQLTENKRFVIPGFYGTSQKGSIKLLPRGGSDITGALVAKFTQCKLYENWTDVDGVFTAQPSIVPEAKPLSSLTFREMRELGYRGADVLQKDALLPLTQLGVPINVRNTFNKTIKGTMIVTQRKISPSELITGIAGRSGFTSIELQKYGLNDQKGVMEKITAILKKHNVSFEHNPTGLDSVSIILTKEAILGKEKKILKDLDIQIKPDYLSMKHNHLALICLVGEGLVKNPLAHTKTAAILFHTLITEQIQIHAIISATAGIDIVIAIEEKNLSLALKKIHKAFF